MAEVKVAVRIDNLRAPLRKSLQLVSAMGARAVEIDARNGIRPSELSDTGLRQLRKMLDDLDLRVASVRFPTRRGYDTPQDLDRRIEATKAAMQFAYRVGAPVVVNQIGMIPEEKDDPRYITLQSVMEDLGSYGTRIGAMFAAETGTESGETMAELLNASEDSYVAAAFNPGQLIINRHSPRDAIKALGNRIQLVCAVDGVIDLAAGRGLSVPLGQGTADFPELLGMLEDFQFRGPFVVGRREMAAETVLEELTQGVAYLRNL
ncbi:Xylose isomerase-like TIM barrel [Novipirellula galeiformis]|uniref:Xylose isomerase-like TIM barrel n=1 Tax=Novipirellula galeiformis TaxID=2528004 RepID=A0A5C6CC96_9BACT|nr:sugar phosphate isomerase/epimerase family protein [Novipirellula galeiformis]TWU22413.1 Xylose isomerase-like TIM barrel [Novipirellula galeiformis]